MEPRTDGPDHPRVLIANERNDGLALIAPIVVTLRSRCALADRGQARRTLGLGFGPPRSRARGHLLDWTR